MPFLLLICLMTVCLPIDWPKPMFGMGTIGSLLGAGLLTATMLLAAGGIAQITVRQLHRKSSHREAIAHRYANARTYFFFATLGVFATILLVFGWGATVHDLASVWQTGKLRLVPATDSSTITSSPLLPLWTTRQVLIPAGELLILAPFLIIQIGSWAYFYDADRAFYRSVADSGRTDRFWSRLGYVWFLSRQQLILVLAPLFLLMGQQALERFYPEILEASWLPFASLMVLPSFLILFPLVLPPLLGLRPLEPGPIRGRLEANARRLRFGYAQIYRWDTRGAVANAMVVGVVRWIRYVVFTDRILDELSDDELDGVYGHEVGHAHHGHILFYVLFLMLSFVLLGALVQTAEFVAVASWQNYRTLLLVAPVVLMGAYMFAVFGFVSRRCERQADLFGCRAGSCTNAHCTGHDWTTVLADHGRGLCRTGIVHFIQALRRVEDINGMTRRHSTWRSAGLLGKLHWIFRNLTGWLHTWQHSTIPKRIAFLERVADDPAIERRFQSRVWTMKCVIILGLTGSLIGIGFWRGWDVLLLAM